MKITLFLLGLILLFGAVQARAEDEEYLVSHILCASRSDCESALHRIQAGETFESVAQQVTLDMGSRQHGGHLPWAPAGNYVPQFADEVRSLGPGQISSAPIHTAFGWHIVKVDAVRPIGAARGSDSAQ